MELRRRWWYSRWRKHRETMVTMLGDAKCERTSLDHRLEHRVVDFDRWVADVAVMRDKEPSA
jgi:pyruvate dehydrogenase complex dehydrogenase (E1) component